MRRQFVAIVVPAMLLALLAIPCAAATANVHFGQGVYRFSVNASNGYRLRLSTYRNNTYRRISLKAENEFGQFARYSVEAVARGGRVDVTFPGLGEVKVRMHRAGSRSSPHRKAAPCRPWSKKGSSKG